MKHISKKDERINTTHSNAGDKGETNTTRMTRYHVFKLPFSSVSAETQVSRLARLGISAMSSRHSRPIPCIPTTRIPLVIEDILGTEHRPKLENYDDYLFLITKMLIMHEDGSIEYEQISCNSRPYFLTTSKL